MGCKGFFHFLGFRLSWLAAPSYLGRASMILRVLLAQALVEVSKRDPLIGAFLLKFLTDRAPDDRDLTHQNPQFPLLG